MSSLFLYFADARLSRAELSAARLDGHVVEIGEAYMPADAVETAVLRAGSLRRVLGDALAATHVTAAWVHGVLADPPSRHTVQRASATRIHHVTDNRLHYRDGRIAPRDLTRLAGVAVTTPARTLADLVRVDDDAHRAAAVAWATAEPALVAQAQRWFAANGPVPHKRRAPRAPAAARRRGREGQDDVTRYTS